MENWQVALLVLAAIFVGALIPMLVQYQLTLRSLNRLIRDNEGDVRRTTAELARLTEHLNHLGAAADSRARDVGAMFDAFHELTEGAKQLRGTLKTASVVGAAVAPAIAAAIRAFQEPRQEPLEESGLVPRNVDGGYGREGETPERD